MLRAFVQYTLNVDLNAPVIKDLVEKYKDIEQFNRSITDKYVAICKDHPTFRVMRQSCSAYSLSLKYLSSLKPYALRFITFILLFIPSTLAVEI